MDLFYLSSRLTRSDEFMNCSTYIIQESHCCSIPKRFNILRMDSAAGSTVVTGRGPLTLPPPPLPPQPLWSPPTLESKDILSSCPPVGLDLRCASYFVPSSSVVGKRLSVSSVERLSLLSSVSSEAVILRFLGAWVFFVFAILSLGK